MAQELTASQKAQLFAMSTRQNMHMLAREVSATAPATVQFILPKARLLASLMMKVKFKVKANSAVDLSGMSTYEKEQIFGKAFTRVALDLNNGFSPFTVNGEELLLYNKVDINGVDYNTLLLSDITQVGTEDTDIEMCFYLPVTLSERDPIGLVLLQSDLTQVTLSINTSPIGRLGDITYEASNFVFDVMTTTYSVPANANAVPDLSTLKLVNGRSDAMPTAGQQIIKLATGTIYRKIIFRITDENNEPVDLDFITAPFELVFNQADTNYRINADMLRIMNTKLLGYPLPKGCFVLDFSNAGSWTNLGGTRDLIDSANLNELWLRFTTGGRGKIDVVTECIARLSAVA